MPAWEGTNPPCLAQAFSLSPEARSRLLGLKEQLREEVPRGSAAQNNHFRELLKAMAGAEWGMPSEQVRTPGTPHGKRWPHGLHHTPITRLQGCMFAFLPVPRHDGVQWEGGQSLILQLGMASILSFVFTVSHILVLPWATAALVHFLLHPGQRCLWLVWLLPTERLAIVTGGEPVS